MTQKDDAMFPVRAHESASFLETRLARFPVRFADVDGMRVGYRIAWGEARNATRAESTEKGKETAGADDAACQGKAAGTNNAVGEGKVASTNNVAGERKIAGAGNAKSVREVANTAVNTMGKVEDAQDAALADSPMSNVGSAGNINGESRESADDPLPLVLLHGIGSGSASWVQQLETLGGARRVLAWDAPGYGASTPLTAASPVAADYARALARWLDALGIGRCVLVGHSLGAIIAGAFAAAYPARVEGLLLISPAAGYGAASAEIRAQTRDARLAMLAELGPQGLAQTRSANMLSPHASDAARAWVRWNMARVRPHGYAQATHLLANADLAASLAKLAAGSTFDSASDLAACLASDCAPGSAAGFTPDPVVDLAAGSASGSAFDLAASLTSSSASDPAVGFTPDPVSDLAAGSASGSTPDCAAGFVSEFAADSAADLASDPASDLAPSSANPASGPAARFARHSGRFRLVRRVRMSIAVGEEDTITPPAACERLAQAARVPLRVVPRAGHAGYIEKPDAYNALIDAFCRAGSGQRNPRNVHGSARANPHNPQTGENQ